MSANIVQQYDENGNPVYSVTSSDAVGMSDGSGNLTNYLNKRVTELNISVLYPTNGEGGTNKYTLAGAIAQVPAEYRTIQGLKITFINNATSKTETWKYEGNTFTSTASWKQGEGSGGNKILEWSVDAVTTRKQVNLQERKALLQISYTNADGDIINEQYIAKNISDTEWVKDVNWVKIPNQSQINGLGSNAISIEFLYDGKYINKTGKEANYTGLSCSDFIEIDGLSLSFNCYIFGDACGIALFDADKKFITSYGSGSDINIVTIVSNIEITNNVKYARFTTATAHKKNCKIIIDGNFFNKRTEPINSYIESVSNVTNKEIALPNNLGVVNDKYFDNKGSVQNYSSSSAGYTITETYIPVKPSHDYSLVNYLSYGYIVFYTADKVLISTVGDTSQSKTELEFKTPENCAYIRTTFNRNKKETPSIINKGASYPIDNADEGTEVEIDVMPAKVWLHNFLGGLKFNTFKNKGFCFLLSA